MSKLVTKLSEDLSLELKPLRFHCRGKVFKGYALINELRTELITIEYLPRREVMLVDRRNDLQVYFAPNIKLLIEKFRQNEQNNQNIERVPDIGWYEQNIDTP
jgi:hypothetical protein